MKYLAIKCICRKLRAINKLIGPNINFKFDETTGILYAICKGAQTQPNSSFCIYPRYIPKKLFNILLRRKIISANVKLITVCYTRLIILKCNGKSFALMDAVNYIKNIGDPPNCIYPIEFKLFMGCKSNSMFIDDKIYSTDSRYGLLKINTSTGESLIVSCTNNGPVIIEGLQTTMSTGNYEKYGHNKVLQQSDFNVYGLQFADPSKYTKSTYKYDNPRYPLFMPVIPYNVYENNMGQLVVNTPEGKTFTFNDNLPFDHVKFHKTEDWPIEIIKCDGSSERFNFIVACQDVVLDNHEFYGYLNDIYIYTPHLINRNNIALDFNIVGADRPLYNKYGYMHTIDYDFTNFSTLIKKSYMRRMFIDKMGNYYGHISAPKHNFDEETDTNFNDYLFIKMYLKNTIPSRTKPAR